MSTQLWNCVSMLPSLACAFARELTLLSLCPSHTQPSSPPPHPSLTHLGATIKEALGWWAKPPFSVTSLVGRAGEPVERRTEKLPACSCTPSRKAVTSKKKKKNTPRLNTRRSWLEKKQRVSFTTVSSCLSLFTAEGEQRSQKGETFTEAPVDLTSLVWVHLQHKSWSGSTCSIQLDLVHVFTPRHSAEQ